MTKTEKAALEASKKKAEKKDEGLMAKFKTLFAKLFDQFGEAVLADGTVIMYDGELAVGTVVTVSADGNEIPLPEGVHALGGDMEGKSIVVDIKGSVVEIQEADEQGEEGGEEEMSDEEKAKKEAEEKAKKEAEEKLAKEKQEAEAKAKTEAEKKISEELEALKKENAEMKKGILEMKKAIEKSEKQKFIRKDAPPVDHISKKA